MVIAGVLDRLLVAVSSNHSKGDEAVWDARWGGAAHLWGHQKGGGGGVIRWLKSTVKKNP